MYRCVGYRRAVGQLFVKFMVHNLRWGIQSFSGHKNRKGIPSQIPLINNSRTQLLPYGVRWKLSGGTTWFGKGRINGFWGLPGYFQAIFYLLHSYYLPCSSPCRGNRPDAGLSELKKKNTMFIPTTAEYPLACNQSFMPQLNINKQNKYIDWVIKEL